MEPVTSAVMVLLPCSPDMLPCREPVTRSAAIFSTISDCENALGDQLASMIVARKTVVGQCRTVDGSIEPTTTGSAALGVKDTDPAEGNYATVHVTRGADAVTTAHVVRRAETPEKGAKP